MIDIGRRRVLLGLAAAPFTVHAASALAQGAAFPGKPVRIVVPYGAGGIGDFSARALAAFLARTWPGATALVENRPGAQGLIAMNAVKQVKDGGHTVVMTSNTTLSGAPYLFSNLAYQPNQDFRHLGLIGLFGSVAVVRADAPYRTLEDLVAHCKRIPEGAFFAYTNASSQVPAEMLSTAAGLKLQGVSYKDVGQATTDLISGLVDFMFLDYVAANGLIKGGRLLPLAVTQSTPAPLWPELPTMATFYPGFEFTGYITLSAPADIPDAVADAYNAALRGAAVDAAYRQQLEANGLVPQPYTRDQLQTFIRAEDGKWKEYARVANLKPMG